MIKLSKFSSIFIANWKLNGNTQFISEYYQKLLPTTYFVHGKCNEHNYDQIGKLSGLLILIVCSFVFENEPILRSEENQRSAKLIKKDGVMSTTSSS